MLWGKHNWKGIRSRGRGVRSCYGRRSGVLFDKLMAWGKYKWKGVVSHWRDVRSYYEKLFFLYRQSAYDADGKVAFRLRWFHWVLLDLMRMRYGLFVVVLLLLRLLLIPPVVCFLLLLLLIFLHSPFDVSVKKSVNTIWRNLWYLFSWKWFLTILFSKQFW